MISHITGFYNGLSYSSTVSPNHTASSLCRAGFSVSLPDSSVVSLLFVFYNNYLLSLRFLCKLVIFLRLNCLHFIVLAIRRTISLSLYRGLVYCYWCSTGKILGLSEAVRHLDICGYEIFSLNIFCFKSYRSLLFICIPSKK